MANEKAENGEPLLGGLLIEEMAIRQHVEWNQHTKSDNSVPAKGALVFMVTIIQDSWKIPVGYFLTARFY